MRRNEAEASRDWMVMDCLGTAVDFARTVLEGRYERAYAMTSLAFRQRMTIEELRHGFEPRELALRLYGVPGVALPMPASFRLESCSVSLARRERGRSAEPWRLWLQIRFLAAAGNPMGLTTCYDAWLSFEEENGAPRVATFELDLPSKGLEKRGTRTV